MIKVGLLAKLEGVKAHVADGAIRSAAISATGAAKPFTGVVKNEVNRRARSIIGPNQWHPGPSTIMWAA